MNRQWPLEVLDWHLSGETEENNKTSVRIAGVLAGTRTVHLQNTSGGKSE
jgi:hypothetical protein